MTQEEDVIPRFPPELFFHHPLPQTEDRGQWPEDSKKGRDGNELYVCKFYVVEETFAAGEAAGRVILWKEKLPALPALWSLCALW